MGIPLNMSLSAVAARVGSTVGIGIVTWYLAARLCCVNRT